MKGVLRFFHKRLCVPYKTVVQRPNFANEENKQRSVTTLTSTPRTPHVDPTQTDLLPLYVNPNSSPLSVPLLYLTRSARSRIQHYLRTRNDGDEVINPKREKPSAIESSPLSDSTASGNFTSPLLQDEQRKDELQNDQPSIPSASPTVINKHQDETNNTKSSFSALRVDLTPGGCQGLSYAFTFESAQKYSPDKDVLLRFPEGGVVIRRVCMSALKGSTLDFHSELKGSAFVITNNPNADTSCSCGTSFTPWEKQK